MKRVYQVSPEMNVGATYKLKAGTSTFSAAPFDTPTHIILTTQNAGLLLAQFIYAFGSDEHAVVESIEGGIRAYIGEVSGRVMRLEIPRERYDARLAGAAEEFKTRQHRLAESTPTGAPLRMAAHYGLVGSQLLPKVNNLLAQEIALHY
jgi:hypothetical protein